MEGKVRFGLKSKILLSLIVLLAFSIGFNFYFSYDLFLKDKTSYIFETGLKRTESLSDQLIESVKSIVQKSDLYALIKKTNPDKIQKLINADESVLLFSKIEANKFEYVFYNQKIGQDENKSESLQKSMRGISLEKFVLQLGQEKNGIRIGPAHDLLNYPSIVVQLNRKEFGVFLFVLDLRNITRSISEDNIFDNNLFAVDGHSYISGKTRIPSYFSEILRSKFVKGTREFNVAGRDELVSFVRYPEFNFIVLSSIEKSKALLIAQTLIKRSLLFGGALLSASIFFGVLFSSKLTSPIRLLAKGTEEIGKGNYDHQVNVQTKDEISLLANSFNSMSSEIKNLLGQKEVMISELREAKLKLEDYSKNLEKMVEQRTVELKEANDFLGAMVNSLDQGLMVFNEESICHDVHTKATETIFGTSPVGKPFYDVLGMETEKEIEGFKRWKDILFSEKIPFDSAVRLGPQNKVYGEDVNSEGYKFVGLEYYPMRNEDNSISNIVAVATDKTEEIKAVEAFKEKEAYVTMVLKMIHSKKQFFSFLDEVEAILAQFEEVFSEDGSIDIPKALILFHSMNGGFGMYSVLFMQQLARKYEGELVELKEQNDPDKNREYGSRLRENVLNYQVAYEEFIGECESIFGKNFKAQTSKIEIEKEVAQKILSLVKEVNNPELERMAEDYLLKEEIQDHFASYAELVASLAEKLNKKIAPVKFVHGDLRVDAEKYQELFNVMVHLFRNCADHGIESEFERTSNDKPAEGHITVSFDIEKEHEDKMLSITVEDDGGGIDPARIRAKLSENNPDESFDDIEDNEIIYRIFDPTFSTAEEVTSVSGRGVGMSAIKDVIDKNGGKLTVNSTVGQGTRFNFQVPIS